MIKGNKSSQRSMDFTASCLSKCRRTHTDCCPLYGPNRAQKPRPPTRLLDVASAATLGIIQLVNSASIATEDAIDYAIFSYCWGGPQPLTLNRNTEEMLSRGISVAQLGKTVQDAVQVSNKLGIRYLWIDALCILQDNSDDKDREIANMASYYQGGVLAICAASAKSYAEGFLSSSEPNAYSIGPFGLEFKEGQRIVSKDPFTPWSQMDEAEIRKVAAESTVNHVQPFKMQDDSIVEPITLHAWTFQEAILSTRLLIFSSQQIYWCCQQSYVGCGGVQSFEKTEVIHPDCPGEQGKVCVCGVSLVRHTTPLDPVPRIFTLRTHNRTSTDAQWDMVVTKFSGRARTVESDKLIAFAAAAEYFETLFGARGPHIQYAAGLWFSRENPFSFVRQLVWSSQSPATVRRPGCFRAPSWSWASIDGQIKPFDRNQMHIHYYVSLTVVKISTELTVPTVFFGAISSAKLIVRGKLRDWSIATANDHLHMSLDSQDDAKPIASNPSQIKLLKVIPFRAGVPSPIGLILHSRPRSNEEIMRDDIPCVTRLGIFVFERRNFEGAETCFSGCEEEEICNM